jgi:hypothetical protein
MTHFVIANVVLGKHAQIDQIEKGQGGIHATTANMPT